MSNEEIVKAKWPDAQCILRGNVWWICRWLLGTGSHDLSWGHSKRQAWAKAAARILESEDGK